MILIDEQYERFRAGVRDFVKEVVEPRADDIDREGKFPEDVIKACAEKGYLGLVAAEELGGAGTDTMEYTIVVEEVSRVCGSTGIILAAHNSLGVWPIVNFGTEEQIQEYVPPLARGERLGSFGLTESNAGSDAAGTQTTAVLDGDHYVINGSKCFITNASDDRDTGYVITAVTDKEQGVHGISSFIILGGTPGFRVAKHENKMGLRGSETAVLELADVKLPKENLLGQEGEGFKQFMITLDGGRISIGAMALGIAQGALDHALERAKTRVQFGRPIGTKQAIQFKIADMATQVDAARALVYNAALLKDAGKPFSTESAIGKLYASEASHFCTYEAIQIFGGYGYMRDYPLERFYRDSKLMEIGEGTSEIQRIVIGRNLLGRLS
jgi:butyryl-CoA dehydrogenase